MNREIVFHRLAELELVEAFQFYENERSGLGVEFRETVRDALDFLEFYPEMAPIMRGRIRCLVLPRFPFSLLYRLLADGSVRILALAHHSRRPDYWDGRN